MATNEERIIPINLDEEMQNSYLLYSMSVIVSRALPDVRDGLKPVQRRILQAMDDLNLGPNAQMRKSAKVAGDTSGNYHPHGEAVIYPTMVRMAQDFNARYPLIQGQGNLGCFTGDTRIKLLDGTERSFEELAKLGPGAVFPVYSVDGKGRIVVGEGRNARITRRNAELVEVTLDNGATIRCTPDHRFLLRDGTYKQAQHLAPADSLTAGYFDAAPVKEGLNEYLRVYQPATGEPEFVHHLADEYNARKGLARQFAGPFVRHHKNFNRWDNSPENIERLGFLEHLHVHAEHLAELWSDDAFRKAQRQGVQRHFEAHPEALEASARRFAEQNRSEEFRKQNGPRVSAALKQYFAANPEAAAEISRRMRALWADPDYRVRMSAALQGIAKRPLSPEEKARVAAIISEKSRAMWGDEEKRAEIVEAISRSMASEAVRARLSELGKMRWQDPEYRSRYGEDHFAEMARTLWSDPATREQQRDKIGRQREDSAFRDAQSAGVKHSNARRLRENPRMMQEMTDRAAASLTQKWTDPQHRARVMRQRIARYGSRLLAQHGDGNVTPELYEKCRDANWIPRLGPALAYFRDFEELLEVSRHYNHRIVSIRHLVETADVYDITVDEYHNFLLADGVFVHNSVDGDPPAAMRYTEMRMSVFAMEMMADIDKNTVDWEPNYDQTRQQPTVLPSRIPNLLMNGSTGIAVGMATNIPPHNLSELCDAVTFAIDKPDATADELMTKLTGPDFPTAGLILGTKGIRQAYTTGRGSVVMQAKTQIEPMDGGKNAIVITELPYQVNKARLIEQIADLVKAKKVDGITDLQDYTDKHGMRVVVELRRDAHPQKILNYLLKHTPLRSTFGVIMLALVNGMPKILSLPQVIQHFIRHRQEVIRRRTEWELQKARERAHIVEGLIRALDLIDQIITLIRASRTVEVARTGLVEQFQFTVIQADAILQMQLQRLVNLERQKLQDEYKELIQRINYLEDLLANPSKILGLIKDDMKFLKQKYGDARRTRIVPIEADQIGDEDTIPEEEMIVTITRNGYIKRLSAETYRVQRRGGRGVIAATSKEEDEIDKMFVATTHHFILFFTDRGRVYRLKAYEVPLGSRQAMGTAIINLISIEPGEKINATVPIRALDQQGFLVMATANGEIKRSKLSEFQNLRANGLKSFDVEDDDQLCWVHLTTGNEDIVIASEQGQAVRFPESELRPSGRASGGVRGMSLEPGDRVVGMEVARPDLDLLVVSQNGYGKRTALSEYPRHHRGGKGVRTMRVTDKTGPIADLKVVEPDDRLLIITAGGIVIRTRVDEIRRIGRATEGVRVINLGPDDRVASIEAVAKAEESDRPSGARVDVNAVADQLDAQAVLVGADGDGALEDEDVVEPEAEDEE